AAPLTSVPLKTPTPIQAKKTFTVSPEPKTVPALAPAAELAAAVTVVMVADVANPNASARARCTLRSEGASNVAERKIARFIASSSVKSLGGSVMDHLRDRVRAV